MNLPLLVQRSVRPETSVMSSYAAPPDLILRLPLLYFCRSAWMVGENLSNVRLRSALHLKAAATQVHNAHVLLAV
jgi:hypothetical protein